MAVLAELSGIFWGAETLLRDLRASQFQRPVSGEIVFVAIDATSLGEVGTWPWSRQVHATLVDRLAQSGASEIFFDIDFSFASDAPGDRAFADALDRAGNVSLPIFVQPDRIGSSDIVVNRPLEEFAAVTWPVIVNIAGDHQGLVRDYPFGRSIDGAFAPSAAAALSGRYEATSESFDMNFSIDPVTMPIYSAFDVIEDRIPRQAIDGRVVIVGSSAIELGDFFSVPVHGVLPGAVIHALAAETLIQSAVPFEAGAEFPLAVLAALAFLLQGRRFDGTGRFLLAFLLSLVAAEAIVSGLAAQAAIIVPTAVSYLTLGAFSVWLLATRLNIRDWIIRRQSTEIEGTQALLRQVFHDSLDAIVVADEGGEIVMQSRSAEALFGTDSDGRITIPASLKRKLVKATAASDDCAPITLQEAQVGCRDGLRHLEFSITPSSVASLKGKRSVKHRIATLSVRDVTALREREEEIAYLSSYDALTGALRRHTFLEFILLRQEAGETFAVFVLNLCRFKTVNAVLGRSVGDAVLTETVTRIERAGLGLSAVARLDGDTFAVFSEKEVDADGAAQLAGRILGLFDTSFAAHEANAKLTARIGYVVIPSDSDLTPTAVLSRAEEALDAARSADTQLPQPYNTKQSEKQRRAREIERAMDGALERDEFVMTYQPQHRLPDCQLIGSEALLRWNSDTLGSIRPDEFIEIAEQSGFIVDLGKWILRQSMSETLQMPGELSVAINVSGAQFLGNDVVRDVTRALSETGFPASRLWLELTETVVMSSSDQIADYMRDIQFTGASWALDDFGTGYSSLAYLTSFPLEKVKLDRSFARDLDTDPRAATVLRAVGDICRGLDMKLLCEGVETSSHVETLIANGCDEAQGFHFGKPLSFDEFVSYAHKHQSANAKKTLG